MGVRKIKKFAFVGGLLIDGTGKDPVSNSLVLVEDKKVKYAGKMKEFEGDYERIDITGKTIMPGLIDSHLHFSGNLTDNDSDGCLNQLLKKRLLQLLKLVKP